MSNNKKILSLFLTFTFLVNSYGIFFHKNKKMYSKRKINDLLNNRNHIEKIEKKFDYYLVNNQMIKNIRSFNEMSDYQKIYSTELYNLHSIENLASINYKDYTLLELYHNYFNDNNNLYDLIYNGGLGNIKLVEIVNNKETDFNCLVFIDSVGNYNIYFQGSTLSKKDVLFDIYNFSNYKNNKSTSSKVLNDIYEGQINDAENVVLKYLSLAKKNNTKVYFQGFSLGASIAELMYYKYYNSDLLGNMVLFNGFHNCELNEELDEFMMELKKNNKLFLYANNGDLIHLLNHSKLNSITNNINVDYKKIINNNLANKSCLFDEYKLNIDNFIEKYKGTKIVDIEKYKDLLIKLFIIFDDIHSIKIIKNKEVLNNNFDSNGNYINNGLCKVKYEDLINSIFTKEEKNKLNNLINLLNNNYPFDFFIVNKIKKLIY